MAYNILKRVLELKNSGQYDEAVKLAKSGFRKTCDNCFNNEIYNCLSLQGKNEEAIKVLKKMLKYEPYNLMLLKRLGYSYYLTGNYKNALKYYKEAWEREPASPENNYNVGMMYHYLKDTQNAYKYYYNAYSIKPAYAPAINNIGLLYFEAGDYENAMKFFKKAIANSPNHPEAYHHLGVISRVYQNDEEMSELYLKKAIRLDSKYADNHYQLAVTYNKYGKNKLAVDSLKTCLELNPDNIKAKELFNKIK